MQRTIFLLIGIMITLTSLALGQPNISSEIAPAGKLRVGMIAITVLGGVADPIARFIGSKLAVTVEPVIYPSPGAYAQSFGKNEWNIAIGPRALAPDEKAIQPQTSGPLVSSMSRLLEKSLLILRRLTNRV